MMLGTNPTLHIPPWSHHINDPDHATEYSPNCVQEALTELHRYLEMDLDYPDSDVSDDSAILIDPYSSSDEFRMFEFKVRRCPRGRSSHDWTDCPYAHPGEKARRRDPRKYNYSSTPCPEFRKGGTCKKGDGCEFAHGVFECWLHPTRYRTQPCKDGAFCKRRVCFFAHTTEELRVINSPPDTPTRESPPMSNSLRNQQLGKFKSLPFSRNVQVGGGSGFGCMIRPRFFSLPTTPTSRARTKTGFGFHDVWDEVVHEERKMERVESGKDLRAKIFEKLSKANSLNRVNPDQDPNRSANAPDVGWVSELVE